MLPALILAGVMCCWGSSDAAASVMGLDEAIRRTREGSLALRAADLDASAAKARARDAGRVPVPALSLTLENVGGSLGADRAETSMMLEQVVELGGDRATRTGLANAATTLAQARRERLLSALEVETIERFCDAWVLQERRARLGEAERVAARAVEAAEERLKAGAGPPSERSRALGFRALRRIERVRVEAEWEAARRGLARLWGEDVADFDSLALPAPRFAAAPPLERLRAGLATHPVRRAAAAEAAAESWRVRAARAARTPDLQLGAGVRHLAEEDGTGLLFGLSLPVPLWSAPRGPLAAAEAELAAAETRERLAALEVGDDLTRAHGRFVAALSAWQGVRDEVLPAAEEALRLILGAYRSGRSSYLEVQDGQRGLLEAQVVWIETSAEVWRTHEALSRLAGMAPGAPAPGEERR